MWDELVGDGSWGWALGTLLRAAIVLSLWAQWKISNMKGRGPGQQPCVLNRHTRRKRRASFSLIPFPASPHLWGVLHVPQWLIQGSLTRACPSQTLWCLMSVHLVLCFQDNALALHLSGPQGQGIEGFTAISFTQMCEGGFIQKSLTCFQSLEQKASHHNLQKV